MATAWTDLSEHTGTLVALLSGLLTVCAVLVAVIYRKLNQGVAEVKEDTITAIGNFHAELTKEVAGIGQSLRSHLTESAECQRALPKLYLNKDDGDKQIALLFARQNDLRERTLPQDYVRRTEMEALNKSLTKLIDQGFDDIGKRVDKLSDRLNKNLQLKRANGGGE